MAVAVVDHGDPVVSARVLATALSPNADGTGWNLIVDTSAGGTNPQEWTVLKNFTTAPVKATFTTPTHHYPNTNFQYASGNQLRAANGRIFFLSEDLYITYYEETTEQIAQLPPLVETPPIASTVSTMPFSATSAVDGKLWISTQESQFRPTCLSVFDPVMLTWAVVSYPGSGSLSYTVYGYYTAPDTGTAIKTVYNAVGENPWQLWKTDVTPGPNFGTTSMMTFPDGTPAQVPSTGSISFLNIAGQGWVGHFNTDIGHPDNVTADYWLNDGVMVLKTNNVNPSPRNVTPASAPLVSPPQIDLSLGAGLLNWRPNGSSGDYTQVPYTITYASPVTIESLVGTTDGVLGNGQQYEGFVRFVDASGMHAWNGAWAGGVSEPVMLVIDGHAYIVGYPNSVLYDYDLSKPWAASAGIPNPKNLGNYGLTGTQFAGTKYARRLAWGGNAGANGRLYQAGDRERNGNGCGIGHWDRQAGTFAGVYSSADGSTGPALMSSALTSGLLVDTALGTIALATKLVTGPGTAALFLFDYAFRSIAVQAPVANLANLGQIFPTSTPHVICGVTQSPAGKLALYAYDINAMSLLSYVETSIVGTPTPMSQHPTTGAVWLFVANMLYLVDVDTLKISPLADMSSRAPIGNCSAFASDKKFWFNGGSPGGVNGAELYSVALTSTRSLQRLARGREYTP